jgi:hypothetical protein
MEQKKNILEGVKVGDELVYSPWNSLNRIVSVTKVTKTQVECSNNGRYRISDGYEVCGDKWCRSSVRFPNDADEVQSIRDGLLSVRYIRAIKADVDDIASCRGEKQTAIGLDTLKEIYALVHNVKESMFEKK